MRSVKTGKRLGARPLPDVLLYDATREANALAAARRAAAKDDGHDDTAELIRLLQGPAEEGRTAAACALLGKWSATGRPLDQVMMRITDILSQSIYITETPDEEATGLAFSNNLSVACLVRRSYKNEFAAFKQDWNALEARITSLGGAVDSHTNVLELALRRWQVSNLCRVFCAWRNTVKKKYARAKVLCQVLLVTRRRRQLQRVLSAWRCCAQQASVARVWTNMDENLMVLEQNKLQLEQQSAELLEKKAELMAQMVGTRDAVWFQRGRSKGMDDISADYEYRKKEWMRLSLRLGRHMAGWHSLIATHAKPPSSRRRSSKLKAEALVARADVSELHGACVKVLLSWANHVIATFEHEKKPDLAEITNITEDWRTGEAFAVLIAACEPSRADDLLRITWPIARVEAVIRELQALEIDEGNVFTVGDISPMPQAESVLTLLSSLWYRYGLDYERPGVDEEVAQAKLAEEAKAAAAGSRTPSPLPSPTPSRRGSTRSLRSLIPDDGESAAGDDAEDDDLQTPDARVALTRCKTAATAASKEYDRIARDALAVDEYVLHLANSKANGASIRSFAKNDEQLLQREMQTFLEFYPHHIPEVFEGATSRSNQQEQIKDLYDMLEPIREQFPDVKQLYSLYSSGGDTARKANMEFGHYWHFCTECQLFSMELSKQHLAALYADINIRNRPPNAPVEPNQTMGEGLMTPAKFVQALVRLAVVSEFGASIDPETSDITVENVQDAIKSLLANQVLPRAGMSLKMGTLRALLRSEPVQTALRKNRVKLSKVFRTYTTAGRPTEPQQKHLSTTMQTLSFTKGKRMLDDAGLLDKRITGDEAKSLFDAAQNGGVEDDEGTLVYSEFEEWAVALATFLNPSPFEEPAGKLTQLIDVLSKVTTGKKKGKEGK